MPAAPSGRPEAAGALLSLCGSGFGVWGLGFRALFGSLGFGVQGFGFRALFGLWILVRQYRVSLNMTAFKAHVRRSGALKPQKPNNNRTSIVRVPERADKRPSQPFLKASSLLVLKVA